MENEGTDPNPPPLEIRGDWSNLDVDTRYMQFTGIYDYGQFSSIDTPADQGLEQRGTNLVSVPPRLRSLRDYVAQNRRDYTLTLNMGSLADGALGVLLRYVDKNNYYRFSMERDPNHDGDLSDAYIRMTKMLDGDASVLFQDNGTPAELTGLPAAYLISTNSQINNYQVTLEATYPRLFVTVEDADGLPLVDWTVSDSTFSGNRMGLYSADNPGSLYSMFQLTRESPDPDLVGIDVYQEGTGQGDITSTVNGEVGSISTDSTSASFERGSTPTLEAMPAPGSQFDGWYSRSLDGQTEVLISTDSTITLPSLTADQILVAVFSGTPPPPFTLDLNGDGVITAEGDGRIALRYLGGALPDGPLATGPVTTAATTTMLRPTGVDVRSWLDTSGLTMLDVDLDGIRNPFTDGRLIYRFLQQRDQNIVDDVALMNGSVLGSNARRVTPSEIRAFLNQFLPPPAPSALALGAGLEASGAQVVLSAESSVLSGAPSAISQQPSAPSPEPTAVSSQLSPTSRLSSLSDPPITDHGSRITIPMGFASLTVQTATLDDPADDQPLSGPSRPWLQDFVVSSSVADDPNRDLLVTV